MRLMTRRLFEIGVLIVASMTLALGGATPIACGPATPEPGTFWLIGGGGAAILLWRRLRAKK